MPVARRSESSARARGERGMALATTLAIIGAFTILIMGLMSFALSTNRLVGATADEAKVERAAEAALETAMNRLADASPTVGLVAKGDFLNMCAALNNTVTFEGERITRECVEVSTGRAPTDINTLPGAPAGANVPLMTLLGGTPANAGVGFRYSASGTLRFNGNIRSRQAPDIAPTSTSARVQRGTFAMPDSEQCRNLRSWYSQLAMECTAAPIGDPYGTTHPPTWDASNRRTLGTTCPAGTVVTFQPGFYDTTATSTMNRWFASGTDGCDGRIFHFPSGRYFFDVAAPGHLHLNDPTSDFIFGEPVNWSPTNGRARPGNNLSPRVCRPGEGGATLTFSHTSMLKVGTTRATICGDTTAFPGYAIAQVPPVANSGTAHPITPTAVVLGPAWSGSHTDIAAIDSRNLSWGPAKTSDGRYASWFSTTLNASGTTDTDRLTGGELRLRAGNVSGATVATATLTVTLPNVPACGAITVNLLTEPSKDIPLSALRTACNHPIERVGELRGATVRVDMAVTKTSGSTPSPRVDLLDLPVRAVPVRGPALDITMGPHTGLWALGATYVPNTDVVVDWQERSTRYAPFTEGLVANSLTATGPTGNGGGNRRLISSKTQIRTDTPALDLRARDASGREVMRTRLLFDLDNSARTSGDDAAAFVEMLDWRRCTSTGPCT